MRRQSPMARLTLGAVVVFVLWFGVTMALGASPLMRAFIME